MKKGWFLEVESSHKSYNDAFNQLDEKISILLIELSKLLVYSISQCKVSPCESNIHDVSSLLAIN